VIVVKIELAFGLAPTDGTSALLKSKQPVVCLTADSVAGFPRTGLAGMLKAVSAATPAVEVFDRKL
jgi:hypothetical protein